MIRTEIARELWELDQLNLEVAKFRAEYGFSTTMIPLYNTMGKLNKELVKLGAKVARIEELRESIAEAFELVKEKVNA